VPTWHLPICEKTVSTGGGKLKKIVFLIVKFGLFLFVAAYVCLPDFVDSKYGVLAGLAVVMLIVLMAADGLKAARRVGGRND
jgi:hypothetical protein